MMPFAIATLVADAIARLIVDDLTSNTAELCSWCDYHCDFSLKVSGCYATFPKRRHHRWRISVRRKKAILHSLLQMKERKLIIARFILICQVFLHRSDLCI